MNQSVNIRLSLDERRHPTYTFRDLRAHEFLRRVVARAERLPDSSSARLDARALVGADALGGHPVAALAVERVGEEHRLDADAGQVREQPLGLEVVVVFVDAGVVPPHDEVRAAVVLAHDGVENGLPRTGVQHPRGERRRHHRPGGVVVFDEGVVPLEDGSVGVVAGLLPAQLGVDEQAVRALECGLLDVLVAPMGGVTGLEAGDRLPAAVVEEHPRLRGRETVPPE
jgi:hypothetical protein